MAKVTVPPTPHTPLGLDDFTEPTLTRRWGRFWHVLRNAASELWRNRLATLGAVMVLIVLLVALLAPFLARYDPVKQNYREMLQGPSTAHYFGTDKFGRDIWSRVIWGAQRSVIISVLAVMVGLTGGVGSTAFGNHQSTGGHGWDAVWDTPGHTLGLLRWQARRCLDAGG